MRLHKYHGLGNDFLVALASENPDLTVDPDVARHVCDRRRGIGADGLLFAFDSPGAGAGGVPSPDGVDAAMVLLNSDGGEAEISGNGIRCLGQALLRVRGRADGALSISTRAGVRHLEVMHGDPAAEVWIDVDMGPVRPGPALGAASAAFPATHRGTLDIGNPHLVLAVEAPAEVDLATVGPVLEADYPEGINVSFVAATAPDRLELVVWERGAGITEACGSGASAAAVVAIDWGLVSGRITVAMPGGDALVEVVDDSVHLCGPSTYVGEVIVP